MMRPSTGCDNSSSDTSPQPFSPSLSPASPVADADLPVRLVYCDEKGVFRIEPEAVAALQRIKGPVGVVSICGRARQGNTFILNELVERSCGFQPASTYQPYTKGLWLWIAPLKTTALDGTEFNLLLLYSEGIDAYDQTGTYSTQLFSLAVLLSSMFIYNQMGGIDEQSLDRLFLVTQMTKHICIRASGGRITVSEIGKFSPIFVWLLRDFFLDLVEDNRRTTPHDYMELALRPMQGIAKDIAAKNEIRESIRDLFLDRECFTLEQPLNNENDPQRLGQIPFDKLRPEFRIGLNALTKFVFERTRAKEVGATVMTGPILVGITESYLEAINNGAVPKVSSSWQSVEEAGCRRAYDFATIVYMSSFDHSKPPEEGALMEAHDEAVRKSLAEFSSEAIGVGTARKKFEGLLQNFFGIEFEDYKRNAYEQANLQCSDAIQSMNTRLRVACNDFNANMDDILKVLDALLSEYKASSHGPRKWQKLAVFLEESLKGPVLNFVKLVQLQWHSRENKMKFLDEQLEANKNYISECKRCLDVALNEKQEANEYSMQLLERLLSDQVSLLSQSIALDSKSLEWEKKYEEVLSRQKADENQARSTIAALKSQCDKAESRLAATEVEAKMWKARCNEVTRGAKTDLKVIADMQELANKRIQVKEMAVTAVFSHKLFEKEIEMKYQELKLKCAKELLGITKSKLKDVQSKVNTSDAELSLKRHEIKELNKKLDNVSYKAKSFEREAEMLKQEKIHLEEKCLSEFKRFEEVQERCKIAEREAKRATEVVDKARAEPRISQRLEIKRSVEVEKTESQIKNLDRQKNDFGDEGEGFRASEVDTLWNVEILEGRDEARERETESQASNNEERTSTVQALHRLLDSERAALMEANNRAEALSLKLEAAQVKIDNLQQELTKARFNDNWLDSERKTASHGKRPRADDSKWD